MEALAGVNDSIPGDSSLVLSFEPGVVNIAEGKYPVRVDVNYAHNGNSGFTPISPADSLTVQAAPELSIVSITPFPSRITAGRGTMIEVAMEVTNNGQATVELDSASIRFSLGAQDKTDDE